MEQFEEKNMLIDDCYCPNCGSYVDIEFQENFLLDPNSYGDYHCKECGALFAVKLKWNFVLLEISDDFEDELEEDDDCDNDDE